MTGIDGTEVLLIILIGLMVLGPKRLPQIANQIGSWVGQARRMTRVMKRQLEDELNAEEYKIRPLDSHVPSDDDTFSPIHGSKPDTPRVGGMSVQSNVTASDVSLPDDDDELGITPPPPPVETEAVPDEDDDVEAKHGKA